jgi:4,5:9,10-diseco-3-hydroxy-5,9,17-trioxoandrosta-1(10),2-diene-4-oate hydrolase
MTRRHQQFIISDCVFIEVLTVALVIVTDRLAEIRIPALIIGGKRDDLVPIKHSRLLAEEIPHAQLVVFEECGHMVMLESPENYPRTIQDFLDQLVG